MTKQINLLEHGLRGDTLQLNLNRFIQVFYGIELAVHSHVKLSFSDQYSTFYSSYEGKKGFLYFLIHDIRKIEQPITWTTIYGK